MTNKLLLMLVASLLPALARAVCTTDNDCDRLAGATCNSGQCSRTFTCDSDALCRSKTGIMRARCDRELNACFVASFTLGGLQSGQTCGTSDMPDRTSDDGSCNYGLVCRNLVCTSGVVGAGCLTSKDCGANQVCLFPKLEIPGDDPRDPAPLPEEPVELPGGELPVIARRNGIYAGGTCSSETPPSPYYDPINLKYKRSLRVGQPGIDDARAVLRGRQAKTPRQYRAFAAQPS